MNKNEIKQFCEWVTTLKIPAGPLAGKPYRIHPWQRRWITGAMKRGIREAGLSVSRKNGKSGLIALLLLGHLVGPMKRDGWRALVCSMTGRLAQQLWHEMNSICKVNNITHLRFLKNPPPGVIEDRKADIRVDFLAADKATGHAFGADIALIDEAGLLDESHRKLWNAMMSSVSSRDGKFLCISIRGESPMFDEMAARAGANGLFWTEYAGDPTMPIDDPENWAAANPALRSRVKSRLYMRDMAARALASPNDRSSFLAYDLNLPQEPTRELILSVADWQSCVVDKLPPRDGICCLGIDLGGSTSMTAAVAYWPQTRRLEAWGAFPSQPDLGIRGEADGVGGQYLRMRERGEVYLMGGRVTDIGQFLDDVYSRLAGEDVVCAMDRYRQQEAREALDKAGIHRWNIQFRGVGAGQTAHGSADIRAFQRLALRGDVKTKRSLLMESAIQASTITRDKLGNPRLGKAKQRGRIDALQAGVLALGLGERALNRPERRLRYEIIA